MNNKYELHQIKTYFHTWSNYTYIILDKITKSAFVVDPAWELNKIMNKLKQINAELVAIFLTHSHYDHINLVNPLIKTLNPVVYMSKSEIDYYKFRCSNLNALNDNEIVGIGRTEIISIHTPGHTAGGMCFLLQDSLFTGDTIFTEGCGICYGDGSSAMEMFKSIQKVKSQVPKNVQVYPGHSYGKAPGHTMEQLAKENIYFQINEEENFVNFRMRKNQKGIFDFK